MSKRGQAGADTDGLGRYYTDPQLALACLDALPISSRPGTVIADTSAGSGTWLEQALAQERRAAAARGEAWTAPQRRLLAMDVDPGCVSMDPVGGPWERRLGDFLDPSTWPADWPVVDWSVGNPPYSVRVPYVHPDGTPAVHPPRHKRAGEPRTKLVEVCSFHVLRGLQVARNVAVVVRSGFLGTARVEDFPELQDRLRFVWDLIPRPSFTGGGTDGSEYVLAWWDRDHRGGPVDRVPLRWKGKARRPRRVSFPPTELEPIVVEVRT